MRVAKSAYWEEKFIKLLSTQEIKNKVRLWQEAWDAQKTSAPKPFFPDINDLKTYRVSHPSYISSTDLLLFSEGVGLQGDEGTEFLVPTILVGARWDSFNPDLFPPTKLDDMFVYAGTMERTSHCYRGMVDEEPNESGFPKSFIGIVDPTDNPILDFLTQPLYLDPRSRSKSGIDKVTVNPESLFTRLPEITLNPDGSKRQFFAAGPSRINPKNYRDSDFKNLFFRVTGTKALPVITPFILAPIKGGKGHPHTDDGFFYTQEQLSTAISNKLYRR